MTPAVSGTRQAIAPYTPALASTGDACCNSVRPLNDPHRWSLCLVHWLDSAPDWSIRLINKLAFAPTFDNVDSSHKLVPVNPDHFKGVHFPGRYYPHCLLLFFF